MPSPIAHAAAGYAIYHLSVLGRGRKARSQKGTGHFLLPVTIGLSFLPDLDFVPGLFSGAFGRYHNTFSNSLFTGFLIALGIGVVTWILRSPRSAFWFLQALVAYELLVIMDFFTDRRGVMLLWPFFDQRYEPAVYLFYGLYRSAGLVSIRHFWTLLTEIVFSLLVILLIQFLYHTKYNKQRKTDLNFSNPLIERETASTQIAHPRIEIASESKFNQPLTSKRWLSISEHNGHFEQSCLRF